MEDPWQQTEEASTGRLDVCASHGCSVDLGGRELSLQGTTDLHCAGNTTVCITPFICQGCVRGTQSVVLYVVKSHVDFPSLSVLE